MIWRKRSDLPLDEMPLRDLVRAYRKVDRRHEGPSGRAEQLDAMAAEVLRRTPHDAGFWFDRAMYAKWRREWTAACELGVQGLERIPAHQQVGEPMAWNLGIAATAVRDWPTARRAWRAFGIDLDGADMDPVDADFGPCPVRLNPEPHFVGEPELVLDGQVWDTEVVWGIRVDPARIKIRNVPLPTSGHRFGDVVLHDGDPHGTRVLDGHDVPVFDEILLWERSSVPTCSVGLTVSHGDDLAELLSDLDHAGLTGEDWTTSVRMLCAACSSGSPGAHDHPFSSADVGDRTLGISGHANAIETVLAEWRDRREGRGHGQVTIELT